MFPILGEMLFSNLSISLSLCPSHLLSLHLSTCVSIYLSATTLMSSEFHMCMYYMQLWVLVRGNFADIFVGV